MQSSTGLLRCLLAHAVGLKSGSHASARLLFLCFSGASRRGTCVRIPPAPLSAGARPPVFPPAPACWEAARPLLEAPSGPPEASVGGNMGARHRRELLDDRGFLEFKARGSSPMPLAGPLWTAWMPPAARGPPCSRSLPVGAHCTPCVSGSSRAASSRRVPVEDDA